MEVETENLTDETPLTPEEEYEQLLQESKMLGEANRRLLRANVQMRALLVGWYGTAFSSTLWLQGKDALADATREFVNREE